MIVLVRRLWIERNLNCLLLFADNLPDDVGLLWFRKFFNQFGVVKDAFIPIKRNKVSNRRFGFVRYNCATLAEVAISKANDFLIEDRKLFVKNAAFVTHRKKPLQNKIGQDSTALSLGAKYTREMCDAHFSYY